MNVERPICWEQGTLLGPQHFQLLERTCQGLFYPYETYLQPHFWGAASLSVRKSALGTRIFELLEGEFLFPDGTFVSLADNGRLDPRPFDADWVEGGKPFTVYLGLKKWCESGENVSVLPRSATLAEVATRFVAGEAAEVGAPYAGGDLARVPRLRFALKIFWENELDRLGAYESIPIAQLERFGAEVRLAEDFIPPCLCCCASETLQKLVREIRDQVAARGFQLEELKSRRGIQTAEFGSRDMVYFLALRSVNRYLPLLSHYTEVKRLHPWQIYGVLRQLIGELSAFSERVGVLGELSDGKKVLPAYDHDRLWSCFSAAQELISHLLDEITAGPEYVTRLAYDGTFYGADLKPAIFDGRNRFYLSVRTGEDPKSVLRALAEVVKLSSPEHLHLLLSRSLPGIGLQYLQIPPQELPRRSNTVYCAIDHHDEQWGAVSRDNCIALHWNGAPADLEIDLLTVGR